MLKSEYFANISIISKEYPSLESQQNNITLWQSVNLGESFDVISAKIQNDGDRRLNERILELLRQDPVHGKTHLDADILEMRLVKKQDFEAYSVVVNYSFRTELLKGITSEARLFVLGMDRPASPNRIVFSRIFEDDRGQIVIGFKEYAIKEITTSEEFVHSVLDFVYCDNHDLSKTFPSTSAMYIQGSRSIEP